MGKKITLNDSQTVEVLDLLLGLDTEVWDISKLLVKIRRDVLKADSDIKEKLSSWNFPEEDKQSLERIRQIIEEQTKIPKG